MTGCRVSVHFIGGRMPQKRPGRARGVGRRPGKPGNTSGPAGGYRRDGLMARFGQDVACSTSSPKAAPRAPVAVAANVPVRTDPAPSPS